MLTDSSLPCSGNADLAPLAHGIFHAFSAGYFRFSACCVGLIFARWKKISLASLTEVIVYLGTPSLVFTSLASRPLFAGDIAVLFGGVVITFVGVGVLIRLFF